MCELEPVAMQRVISWEGMSGWLSELLPSLDTGDLFELGPLGFRPRFEDAYRPGFDEDPVPCAQALALKDAVLLRLSARPMGAPLMGSFATKGVTLDVWHRPGQFGDWCTFGWLVSRDWDMLGQICVNWFRDRHRMELRHVGMSMHGSISLGGPLGIPPSERY